MSAVPTARSPCGLVADTGDRPNSHLSVNAWRTRYPQRRVNTDKRQNRYDFGRSTVNAVRFVLIYYFFFTVFVDGSEFRRSSHIMIIRCVRTKESLIRLDIKPTLLWATPRGIIIITRHRRRRCRLMTIRIRLSSFLLLSLFLFIFSLFLFLITPFVPF